MGEGEDVLPSYGNPGSQTIADKWKAYGVEPMEEVEDIDPTAFAELNEITFQELRHKLDSLDNSILSKEEKGAVVAYVGACEVNGGFVHPGVLFLSGSELTSIEDTGYLITALWKLGYNPMLSP